MLKVKSLTGSTDYQLAPLAGELITGMNWL